MARVAASGDAPPTAVPKRVRRKDPGVRLQGGRIYDSANGTTCHQCRQKTAEVKAACTRCPMHFCPRCLENRYSERVEEVNATGTWQCPKCRKECNCSNCRKKQGLPATGILATVAKRAGFGSVSALLQVNPKAVAPSEVSRKRAKEGCDAATLGGSLPTGAPRLAAAPQGNGSAAWAALTAATALASEEETESEADHREQQNGHKEMAEDLKLESGFESEFSSSESESESESSSSSSSSSSEDDEDVRMDSDGDIKVPSASDKENEAADVAARAAARFGNVRLTRGMRAAVTEKMPHTGGKRKERNSEREKEETRKKQKQKKKKKKKKAEKKERAEDETASTTKARKEKREKKSTKEKGGSKERSRADEKSERSACGGAEKKRLASSRTTASLPESQPSSQNLLDFVSSAKPLTFAQSLSRGLSETLGSAESPLLMHMTSTSSRKQLSAELMPDLSQLASFSLAAGTDLARASAQLAALAPSQPSSQPSDPSALPTGEPLDLSQSSSQARQLSGSLPASRANSQSSQRTAPRLPDGELGERPGPAPAKLGIWAAMRKPERIEGEDKNKEEDAEAEVEGAARSGENRGNRKGEKGSGKRQMGARGDAPHSSAERSASSGLAWTLIIGPREVCMNGTASASLALPLAVPEEARLATPAPSTPPRKDSSQHASPRSCASPPLSSRPLESPKLQEVRSDLQGDLVEVLAFFDCFETALGLGKRPSSALDLADLAAAVVFRGANEGDRQDAERGGSETFGKAAKSSPQEAREQSEARSLMDAPSGPEPRRTRSRGGARVAGGGPPSDPGEKPLDPRPSEAFSTASLLPPDRVLAAAQTAHEALLVLTNLDDDSDSDGDGDGDGESDADQGEDKGVSRKTPSNASGSASDADDEALGGEDEAFDVQNASDPARPAGLRLPGASSAPPSPSPRSVASLASRVAASLGKDVAGRTWHAMALRAALLAGNRGVQASVLAALERAGVRGADDAPLDPSLEAGRTVASTTTSDARALSSSPAAPSSAASPGCVPSTLLAYWLLGAPARAAILSLLVHVSLDADPIRAAIDGAVGEAQTRAGARRAFEAARRSEARKHALEARDRHLALLVAGLVGPASLSTAHAAPLALTLDRQRDLAAEAARLASAAAGRLPPPTPAQARRFAEPQTLRLRCLGTDRNGRRFHPLSSRVQRIFAAHERPAEATERDARRRFDPEAHLAVLEPPEVGEAEARDASRGDGSNALWCASLEDVRAWVDERGEREGALVDALERRCGVQPEVGSRPGGDVPMPSSALPPRPQAARKRTSKPASKAPSRGISKPTSRVTSRGSSRPVSPTRAPKRRGTGVAAT